jgi:hypothetical protein
VSVLRRVELTTQVGYRVGWGQEGQIARSNGGRWPMGKYGLLAHDGAACRDGERLAILPLRWVWVSFS